MSFRPTVFAHIVGPASTTDVFLSADCRKVFLVSFRLCVHCVHSISDLQVGLRSTAVRSNEHEENAANMNSEDWLIFTLVLISALCHTVFGFIWAEFVTRLQVSSMVQFSCKYR